MVLTSCRYFAVMLLLFALVLLAGCGGGGGGNALPGQISDYVGVAAYRADISLVFPKESGGSTTEYSNYSRDSLGRLWGYDFRVTFSDTGHVYQGRLTDFAYNSWWGVMSGKLTATATWGNRTISGTQPWVNTYPVP